MESRQCASADVPIDLENKIPEYSVGLISKHRMPKTKNKKMRWGYTHEFRCKEENEERRSATMRAYR